MKIDRIRTQKDFVIEDAFVLRKDDIDIGKVFIVYDGFYSEYTVKDQRVYMKGLKIKKEYENQGYAQHLINYIIKLLKEEEYHEIAIGVEDDNEVAKHIYYKLGFTEFIKREKPNKYAPNGFNLYIKRI